jgi:hypothetical protein
VPICHKTVNQYKKYHKTSIDSYYQIREIALTLMLQRRSPNPHICAVTISLSTYGHSRSIGSPVFTDGVLYVF